MPVNPHPHAWGLYISIPFCRFKCTYCNFASGVFPQGDLARYMDALLGEIDVAAALCREQQADSVYLGGGTPSLLSPEQMARLFGALRGAFEITEDAEITLEANPGSVTAELAAAWRGCGVNRVSIGAQSFAERELRAAGRRHSADTVRRDIDTLREAGILHANIDLIAGLPHQTAESWQESLDRLAQLGPDHVSVYMLEIDEDSRLGAEVLAGGGRYSAAALPGEDATCDFYVAAIARLAELDYRQYEISNFALPGCQSRHNLKYWEGAPYLGFGVDAHSYDQGERWANTDSVEEYLARCERRESLVVSRTPIDDARRREERIILGLRRNSGVELSANEEARYQREIDRMAGAGLVETRDGRLRLTERGRLLSNEVFAEFI